MKKIGGYNVDDFVTGDDEEEFMTTDEASAYGSGDELSSDEELGRCLLPCVPLLAEIPYFVRPSY